METKQDMKAEDSNTPQETQDKQEVSEESTKDTEVSDSTPKEPEQEAHKSSGSSKSDDSKTTEEAKVDADEPKAVEKEVTPGDGTPEVGDVEEGKIIETGNKKDSKFNYRDYSHIESTHSESGALSPNSSAIRVQKLPAKLNAMLSNPEFQHIISWMPHGRSWKVHNPHAFVEEVIPKYFEYTNYNSFVRLVNAWGFRRITKGPDRNSYYHELFLRGMPHLHAKMHRLTANEKKVPVDPEDEPDFYKISALCPLPPATPAHSNPAMMNKGVAIAPLPHQQGARNPLQYQKQMLAKQQAAMAGQFAGMGGMNMGGFDPFAARMAGMNPNVAMQAAAAQMEEEELALAAASGGGSGIMGSGFQQRADFLAAQEMRLREQERRLYLAGAAAGPTPGSMAGIPVYGSNEGNGMGRLGRGGMMPPPGMGGGMGMLGVEDAMMGMGGGVSSAMMARLQQQQQGSSQGGQSQFGKGS
mmetsp:Transcript_10375/g.14640  ORF Transcript_10375/g.14640 Transcript_10375/m.14640 type:complete len:470 (+) Transcript_10375:174-1583(+)